MNYCSNLQKIFKTDIFFVKLFIFAYFVTFPRFIRLNKYEKRK
jgi:hypothetical protein